MEVRTVDPMSYYAALGVTPSSSTDVIRRAYLQQSSIFHPDKAAANTPDDVREEMRRRFQRINEAYQVLGDPRTRAAYDAAGRSGIDHLAMIPNTLTDPAMIARSIDLMEQKAELERTTKLIGASGTTTVSFNGVRAWKVMRIDMQRLEAMRERQRRKLKQQQQTQQTHHEVPADDSASQSSSPAHVERAPFRSIYPRLKRSATTPRPPGRPAPLRKTHHRPMATLHMSRARQLATLLPGPTHR
jgi:curved DNA-binding protein CbpA